MPQIDVNQIVTLYAKYAEDLRIASRSQRNLIRSNGGRIVPQLDDVEAEITYMLLRELRPSIVVEFGTFHGWSTSWILQALKANGKGHLHSFDLIDNVVKNVPEELSEERWSFYRTDIREAIGKLPAEIDYLFIDASHTASFARWYLGNVFPLLRTGTSISVHDVYHFRHTLPLHEGRVVVRWLKDRRQVYFTPSRARSRKVFDAINDCRASLDIEAIRGPGDNPMIFFEIPLGSV